jgi:predicted  nucleic acid-binding Zn-ribbon protein
MMSFLTDNVKYQPEFNSVLDEVDILKYRVEELEKENSRLYKLLESLDERINILIDDKP